MMIVRTFISIVVIVSAFCCSTAKMNVKQGIEGHVYRISGNQMPSPDVPQNPPKGVKAKVYVYELTGINQVIKTGEGSFYSAVNTKPVKEFESDKKGFFKVSLPAGRYSIFTKKGALFYANRFDSKNNIAPIEVTANAVTKVDIRIDYDAFY